MIEDADVPLLTEYTWLHGGTALTGILFGKHGHIDGEIHTTDAVLRREELSDAVHVTTESGTYRLGEPEVESRDVRSRRAKPAANFTVALSHMPGRALLGEHGLACTAGGLDAGAAEEASTILCEAFRLDASSIGAAQRIVLLQRGAAVAAAAVELMPGGHALSINMLAVAKAVRRKGLGSVLVAVVMGLAAQLGAPVVMADPTDESRVFWLQSEFHTPAFCSVALRSALRTLEQRHSLGKCCMARGTAALSADTAESARPTELQPEELQLAHALSRMGGTATRAVSAVNAAKARGYIDCHSIGTFLDLDDGSRQSVVFTPLEELPREFKRLPYHKLHAFDTLSARGWGVRSSAAISEGQIVMEVIGRALSEDDFEGLEDLEYVVGFDDRTMAAKRRLGDNLCYIDCRTHGNLMRLVNDCQEAPNLQLLYWPPPDEAAGVMPRRIFLMARHDIPPVIELTFNYGKHYDRHWLKSGQGQHAKTQDDTAATPSQQEVATALCTRRPEVDNGEVKRDQADEPDSDDARGESDGVADDNSDGSDEGGMQGAAGAMASIADGASKKHGLASATKVEQERRRAAKKAKRARAGARRLFNATAVAAETTKRRPRFRMNGDSAGDEVFAVERLLDARTAQPSGKREFLVRWMGYGEAADSWESEDNILDAEVLATYPV